MKRKLPEKFFEQNQRAKTQPPGSLDHKRIDSDQIARK